MYVRGGCIVTCLIVWFWIKFFIIGINVTSFSRVLKNDDQDIMWLIKRLNKFKKSSWAASIVEGHLVCS